VVKPPHGQIRSVVTDVAWFAGSGATAFGLVDLFCSGSVRTTLQMLATKEGRVICIVAGIIGLVVGWLRGRRAQRG
jgi:hypothetical protein